jgi:DNA-binding CsgD family transcriptional regulator
MGSMHELTQQDYRDGWRLVCEMTEAAGDAVSFAHLGGGSHRISDSLQQAEFRESALYNEYYRRIGIDHVIAVPLFVDRGLLVSFVLNRNGKDFSDREREVLEWLAAGKTDREIAELLGMSPRTVQKHLQHIYEKLGVETRTAAVMRALGK